MCIPVTERFLDHLPIAMPTGDEITIEDPAFLDKPWTFTFAYRRMPDYQLLEYVCEDNREYADQNGVQKIRVPGSHR